MNYKPVNIEEYNVNVSKESPLKKAFLLMSVAFGLIIIGYFALGLIAEILVTNLPPRLEKNFGTLLCKPYIENKSTIEDSSLQSILDDLVSELPYKNKKYEYQIYLIKEDIFNAFAAPGGNIFVYEGLLKESENEEELAFVIAHELGHIVHKDPLKALARKYTVAIVSQFAFGNDTLIKSMIEKSTGHLELKFSRNAETKADLFAAKLIYENYGSIDGAINFMEKTEKKQNLQLPKFVYYFSTHPSMTDRKQAVKSYVKKLY